MSEKLSLRDGVLAMVGLVMLVGIGVRVVGDGSVETDPKIDNSQAAKDPEVAADDSSAEKTEAEEPTQTIRITMNKISDDFQDNALRAAELYTGKKLVVTGLYNGASISSDGNAVLDFGSLTSALGEGRTELNEEAKSAATGLKRGDLIQVECHEYDAEGSFTGPKLNNCGSIKKLADQGMDALQYQKMILDELEQK